MALNKKEIRDIQRAFKKLNTLIRGAKVKFYDSYAKKYGVSRITIRKATIHKGETKWEVGDEVRFTFAGSSLKGRIEQHDGEHYIVNDGRFKYPVKEESITE